MSDRVEIINTFTDITGASEEQAKEYLSECDWQLDSAVQAYLADADEAAASPVLNAPAAAVAEPAYTGPRTLDGRPAPHSASMSSTSAGKKPQRRTGVATLSSLGGGDSHGHSHDSDDDSEDEAHRPRDLFAGGEKSGLAVQDPNNRSSDPKKLINDIVAKAKANSKRPESPDEAAAGPSRPTFRGSGQTLGGDGVESRTIPNPRGSAIPTVASEPPQERMLHIWADGFSIDDGELRRFDDPQNQADIQMIRQGRAPLHLMNIRYDERVDVKLQQHPENYHPLPRIYRPFGGEGRRLGSPVPGDGSTPAPRATAATTTAATTTQTGPSQAASTSVDESQPVLTLRIQLPDGRRVPARFNTTHTVGDVYAFVHSAAPATSDRPWVLSTTFPNKDHTDKELVLGEMAEFKRGGTAVVKWT
ncbi:hypothetical protein B0T24DRAFT_560637 [Lasiosphaeria ovina]|uniref:UBX domain-containing protein 1 n=1 Tax=Lasiosphaeria ovina TaxID=92902 RepID=A0AAE0N149_9PEZI|nr:hypothetical protein B0T24DRAFT_560637 [Lasiosphaeria ovina]